MYRVCQMMLCFLCEFLTDKPDKKNKEKEKSKKQGKAKGKKLSGRKKIKLPENLTPEDLTTLLF